MNYQRRSMLRAAALWVGAALAILLALYTLVVIPPPVPAQCAGASPETCLERLRQARGPED